MAVGMFGMGMIEMLMLLVMGPGGMALPLGLPPTEEDPLMSRIAPEQCMFYLSWAGTAQPDASSKNHTEQLLAEAEVQRLRKQLEAAISAALVNSAREEQKKVVVEQASKLFKTALTQPGAVYVGKVAFDQETRGIGVDAGIIINTGSDEQTQEAMRTVHRLEQAFEGLVKEVDIEGQKWKEFPMPPGAPRMLWGFRGHYLILGTGKDAVTGILKRGSGKAPQWLVDLRKQLPVARPSNVMYVNVKRILELAKANAPGPEVTAALAAFGLDNITSVSSVSGFDETGYVTRSLLAIDGEPKGLLSSAKAKPLTIEDLVAIPADATLATAVRLDPERVFNDFRAGLAAVEPRAIAEMDRGLAEMRRETGVDLVEEIFKPLGDTWQVYNSPGEGGLVLTGLTVVGTVKDRDKLSKALDKLQAAAVADAQRRLDGAGPGTRRLPRHVTIKDFEFAGQKVYFVNFVGEESPVAPSWCVTDKEVIFSFYPSHVKAYLSRGKDFQSLAQSPKVTKLFSGEKGPLAVSYVDTQAVFDAAYPLVQIGATFVCGELQREGIELDVSMLPTAGSIRRHLQPSTATVKYTDAGIEMTSNQTLPIGGGAVMMVLPAFNFTARASAIGPRDFDGPAVEEAFPVPDGPGPFDGGANFVPAPATHRHGELPEEVNPDGRQLAREINVVALSS